MIILDGTTKILRARLTGAPASAQPSFVTAWADKAGALGSTDGFLNGTANVTLVAAPAANTQRAVKTVYIYNGDTATVTVVVEKYDGTTATPVLKLPLGPASTLAINDDGITIADNTSVANAQLVGINDQTGTSYTLALSDAGKDVRCNNASAFTLTVPANAVVPFPIGSLIIFSQKGSGAVAAVSDGTSVIHAPNGAITSTQYDARVLEKTDTDAWRVW
jgi:hypothetical protein